MQQNSSSAKNLILPIAIGPGVGAGFGAMLGLGIALMLTRIPRMMDQMMPKMMAHMMPKMMHYLQEAQVEPPCAHIIREMLEKQSRSEQ